MLAGMTETEQSEAFRLLQSMIHSLRDGDSDRDQVDGAAHSSKDMSQAV
jgi:hypothetical protein